MTLYILLIVFYSCACNSMARGPWTLAKVSHTISCVNVTNCRRVELVGGSHPKKINQKNGAWAFSLFAPCILLSILAITLAIAGLLYHLDQKPEYHHERHLVLFALLDWFLIPGHWAKSFKSISQWPGIKGLACCLGCQPFPKILTVELTTGSTPGRIARSISRSRVHPTLYSG